MAKELESATKEFELTEAFWKKYKPDSVKETGLSGKLRDYEKALAKAEKLDADNKASPIDKSKAWGEVLQALNDLTAAMPQVVAALTKDKASHQNLKTSLDRAHKALKGKTHPAYTRAEQRKAETWTAVTDEQEEETGGLEWLEPFKTPDIRKWGEVLGEFHQLAGDMPGAHEFENPLETLRHINRMGTLGHMTGVRTFDKDVDRVIEALEKSQALLQTVGRNHVADINQRPGLPAWLAELFKNVLFELNWWRRLKSSKPR